MRREELQKRYALYRAWGEKCAWCRRPIAFYEMELDHIIPKSLSAQERTAALRTHRLPRDFDLDGPANLVPSCRRCNADKSARLAPNVPAIALLLERASDLAPSVDSQAKVRMTVRSIEHALTRLEIVLAEGGHDPELEALVDRMRTKLRAAAKEGTGPHDVITVDIHPAMSLLWNPDARWKVHEVLGPETAVVSDGARWGIVGTHPTYVCSTCGSNGPWSGNRCLTCGRSEPPWD